MELARMAAADTELVTPKGERAFTLIAVLLALVMLVTGLLALGKSQTNLVKTQKTFSARTRAYQLARQFTEQIRASTSTVASSSATPVDTLGNVTGSSNYLRTITVTSDTTNLYRVIVSVSYPGQVGPATITTLIYH